MENNEVATVSFSEIIVRYNDILEKAIKLNFFVRDIDLQKDMIANLEVFKKNIKNYKKQAVENKDEKTANEFFHMQCVINAFISSLSIWVSLKKSDAREAWDNLIEAQEYLSYASRVHNNGFGIEDFLKKLNQIEKIIFPGFPLYSSLGIRMKGGECSICGRPIEFCEHIEEEIYYGSVCKRIKITDLEIDHSAIVENPKDRRCIITEFEFSPGKVHDYITLKYIRDEKREGENGKKAIVVGMILYSNKGLDLF